VIVLADTVAHGGIAGVAGLDLERRMADLETFTKLLLEAPNQVFAIRGVKVFGDDHVTAQSQLLTIQ
jgi:hypothetical protein